MKKLRITLLSIFLLSPIGGMFAQIGRAMPQWVTNKPSANPTHHYYYRVTMGEATTYDEAYSRAFAKAILEANMKLGTRITVTNEDQVTQDIQAKISMEEFTINIPINKACDYWEQLYYPKRIRIYVLWQIADSALQSPVFDEFNNCD